MDKHLSEKRNHAVRIIPCIIIFILIIMVLYQNRKIRELEKVNSDKQVESNTAVISSNNKSTKEENEYQNRIKELELKIDDMQSWQDYLEEDLEEETREKAASEERTYNNNKLSIYDRFKFFVDERNLSPKEKEEFIELLTQKQSELSSLYKKIGNWEKFQKETGSVESKYDDLIKDLLSADDYIAYNEYLDSEQDRIFFNVNFRDRLTADNKLSRQQEKDLIAAMHMNRIEIEEAEGIKELDNGSLISGTDNRIKRLEALKKVYSGYLEAAQGILTESQMEKLEKVIDFELATIEMNEKQITLFENDNSDTEKSDK